MCAFLDELVDVFADDDGDDDELQAVACNTLHPYCALKFSEVADKAPHAKLGFQLLTELSQDEVVAPPVETASSPDKPHQYLPSPTGKHHGYLPLPKASVQLVEASKQEKVHISPDARDSIDGEEDIAMATGGKAKPFQRPNSSLHSYLFKANESKEVALHSIDKENQDSKSRELGGQSKDFPGKLDIDALIAALPPKEAKPEMVTSHVGGNLPTLQTILADDPELYDPLSSFLCYETHDLNRLQRSIAMQHLLLPCVCLADGKVVRS